MKTKSILSSLAILGVLTSPFANAHTDHQDGAETLCNFAPENELNIPAGMESLAQGIDEKTFHAVIDRIEKVYAPIIRAQRGTLKVHRKWEDGTVNANAIRFFGKHINMYGGLARYPGMTADGYAMVMCHELGHHLGGSPSIRNILGTYGNEGQSDYFAATKCFRRVFGNDDNVAVMSSVDVPKDVTKACSNTFKSQKEIALCQRSAMTGKVLAKVLWSMGRSGSQPREPAQSPEFSTPSTNVVKVTDNSHPLGQCRLDTMMAGSICGVSFTEDFSKDSPIPGSCAEEKGDKVGFRPRCWYKPGR